MKRKQGYYKVVLHGESIIAMFVPDPDGETQYDTWYICAIEQGYKAQEFDSIGEKIEF